MRIFPSCSIIGAAKLTFVGLFLAFFFFPARVWAGELNFEAPKHIRAGETFWLALKLNTDGKCVNLLEGGFKFDAQEASLEQISKDDSVVKLWIKAPVNLNGRVDFVGGMPNGFCGLAQGDPGASNVVAKFLFRAASTTKINIVFSPQSRVYLNDGSGRGEAVRTEDFAGNVAVDDGQHANILSQSHTDSNKWSKNNNPAFNWLNAERSEYFYSLDKDPEAACGQRLAKTGIVGERAEVKYNNIADGIYYFNLRAQKASLLAGKTERNNYRVMIDSTPPVVTDLYLAKIEAKDNLIFSSIDVTAGVKANYLGVDGVFQEITSPFELPANYLKKKLTFKSVDLAGNEIILPIASWSKIQDIPELKIGGKFRPERKSTSINSYILAVILVLLGLLVLLRIKR